MALEKEYDDFDDFDELAEVLQQRAIKEKQPSKQVQKGTSSKTYTTSHPKSNTAKRNISKKEIPPYIKVYKPAVEQPVKKQQPMAKQQTDKKTDPFDEFDSIDDFDDLAEALQREQVPRVGKSPEEISAIADEISRNLQKQFDEEDRQRAKQAKKKQSAIERFKAYNKRKQAEAIAETEEYEREQARLDAEAKARKVAKKQAKDIKKAKEYKKPVRYTEPKKRNMLTRIIHKRKYKNGYYDEIENDLLDGYYTSNDVKVSQYATKRKDKKLYKKVQAYEDARDDKTAGKVFNALAVGLAGVMIAGCLTVGYKVNNSLQDIMENGYRNSQTEQTMEDLDYENMDHDTLIYYDSKIQQFLESVRETDGYEFDYLSNEELIEGYAKIVEKESKMVENTFKHYFNQVATNGDMELLDKIAEESLGTEEYSTLTDEQKRDYRQLAYELLPTALPELFGEDSENIDYIRNPLVIDWINARETAKEEGYSFTIKYVNSDHMDLVKNVGLLMHEANEMAEYDFSALNMTDGGESLLDQMLKQALGDSYSDASKDELSDYEVVLYQFLVAKSDSAKECIVNPVDRDKEIDSTDSHSLGNDDYTI